MLRSRLQASKVTFCFLRFLGDAHTARTQKSVRITGTAASEAPSLIAIIRIHQVESPQYVWIHKGRYSDCGSTHSVPEIRCIRCFSSLSSSLRTHMNILGIFARQLSLALANRRADRPERRAKRVVLLERVSISQKMRVLSNSASRPVRCACLHRTPFDLLFDVAFAAFDAAWHSPGSACTRRAIEGFFTFDFFSSLFLK